MTIVIILVILFAALLIVVPLLERSRFRMSAEQMSKLSRWILPLAIVLILAQLIRHLVG
ncbi:MAG: hypothetical protein NWQ54_17710 [Paraglaciecola sp.]|uniref:hypothetical protein n=1 Tax=Paraglaciecola sp. TaxID=1920173 RepID=UPI00273EF894|nr:hypothetical protein [Paraglaciecola sp.]MDP5031829.1 hypothetical protein [Paraglaciecola sp.]MDP5040234.1 hypothetical protein [Paraglaciecola sp.]MDP5132714.1 hypothetical protein [Paraglaciecola sp.]